jgi:hypothetical protein
VISKAPLQDPACKAVLRKPLPPPPFFEGKSSEGTAFDLAMKVLTTLLSTSIVGSESTHTISPPLELPMTTESAAAGETFTTAKTPMTDNSSQTPGLATDAEFESLYTLSAGQPLDQELTLGPRNLTSTSLYTAELIIISWLFSSYLIRNRTI